MAQAQRRRLPLAEIVNMKTQFTIHIGKNASVIRHYETCMHRGLGNGDWRGKKRKMIIYSYCIHLLMEIFKYVQR